MAARWRGPIRLAPLAGRRAASIPTRTARSASASCSMSPRSSTTSATMATAGAASSFARTATLPRSTGRVGTDQPGDEGREPGEVVAVLGAEDGEEATDGHAGPVAAGRDHGAYGGVLRGRRGR